jgi:hypothetical protein
MQVTPKPTSQMTHQPGIPSLKPDLTAEEILH